MLVVTGSEPCPSPSQKGHLIYPRFHLQRIPLTVPNQGRRTDRTCSRTPIDALNYNARISFVYKFVSAAKHLFSICGVSYVKARAILGV